MSEPESQVDTEDRAAHLAQIESLIAATNHRAALVNQIDHAKQQFVNRCTMAWKGHLFLIDTAFLNYIGLQLLDFKMKEMDGGTPQPIILLDQNKEPVLVRDIEHFVDQAEEIYQEALNDYYDKYQRLIEARNAADVFRVV